MTGSSNPRGDRGGHGEQGMGFFLGEQGYFFVEGPSGAGGHAANASGFDGVAYHPQKNQLVIYDNKSFARSGNVSGAPAIDKNFSQNLNALNARVQGMADLPHKAEILDLLGTTQQAVQAGGPAKGVNWPSNENVAVSNAGGQSTGVTQGLQNKGIKFIDYYAAPKPLPTPAGGGGGKGGPQGKPTASAGRRPNAGQVEGIATVALMVAGALNSWLNDYVTEQRTKEDLAAWERSIGGRQKLDPHKGVLIVVVLKEFHHPDAAFISTTYDSLETFYAETLNEAMGASQRTMRALRPDLKNVRYDFSRRMWIPPLEPLPPRPVTPPRELEPWEKAYQLGKDSLDLPPNYQEFFHMVNGSSMHDILRIFARLHGNGELKPLLGKLRAAKGIGVPRLEAAFWAVINRESPADGAFETYWTLNRSALETLPKDQQNEIRDFFITGQTRVILGGEWSVTIGSWKGLFVFNTSGGVYWTENQKGKQHGGKWSFQQGTIRWQFADDPPGYQRTFVVPLPLKKSAKGEILPKGQGFFQMQK